MTSFQRIFKKKQNSSYDFQTVQDEKIGETTCFLQD